jgi:hypothetical protein
VLPIGALSSSYTYDKLEDNFYSIHHLNLPCGMDNKTFHENTMDRTKTSLKTICKNQIKLETLNAIFLLSQSPFVENQFEINLSFQHHVAENCKQTISLKDNRTKKRGGGELSLDLKPLLLFKSCKLSTSTTNL